MAKPTRTADQLRAMVQVRINALPAVSELMVTKPKAGPIAGSVEAHERDLLGRTWDMPDFFQGAGYGKELKAIVNELRLAYDLAD